MIRLRCFPLLFITLSIIVYLHAEVNAGPLSLSFARSFRSGREIRTPFKGPGIMVARGFGKRNAMPIIDDNGDSQASATITGAGVGVGTETGTGTETETGATIDKCKPSTLLAGYYSVASSSGDGNENDRIPIDWLITEMAEKPNLARLLMHHFVDLNGDGKIAPRKLTALPLKSIEYF